MSKLRIKIESEANTGKEIFAVSRSHDDFTIKHEGCVVARC